MAHGHANGYSNGYLMSDSPLSDGATSPASSAAAVSPLLFSGAANLPNAGHGEGALDVPTAAWGAAALSTFCSELNALLPAAERRALEAVLSDGLAVLVKSRGKLGSRRPVDSGGVRTGMRGGGDAEACEYTVQHALSLVQSVYRFVAGSTRASAAAFATAKTCAALLALQLLLLCDVAVAVSVVLRQCTRIVSYLVTLAMRYC
jgi:hypothetical protein